MFVRCVRATVVVLAIAWAGGAAAQEAVFDGPEYLPETQNEESYVADPNESFIVEHSGQEMAAVAPPAPAQRCREYLTDDDDPYAGGLACPQPDGSWRIVSGSNELIRPGGRESVARREPPRQERPRPYSDYSDYADDARAYDEEARPARRFRLDWNAWNAGRRGNSRSYRDR
jgi:hypothetical protein